MKYAFLLALSALLSQPALADVTARTGGPSESQMLARSAEGAPDGMAFFRPVLSGVLYRAGFQGGDKGRTGLSTAQRQTLCDDGFSTAFYADFGKNTDYGQTSCAAGSLDYAVGALVASGRGDAGDPRDDHDARQGPGARALHVGRPFLRRAVGDGARPVLRLVRGPRQGLLGRGAQRRALFGRLRRLDRRQVRRLLGRPRAVHHRGRARRHLPAVTPRSSDPCAFLHGLAAGLCSPPVPPWPPTPSAGRSPTFTSPNGIVERCVRIAPIPGGDYDDGRSRGRGRRTARSTSMPRDVALCPKTWSTSPGMMVYDITEGPYAGDRAAFERNACQEGKSAKDLAEDDLAKFKVTMNAEGHERDLRAVVAALLPLLALLRHGRSTCPSPSGGRWTRRMHGSEVARPGLVASPATTIGADEPRGLAASRRRRGEPGKLQPDRRSLHRRPRADLRRAACRAPGTATARRSTARASSGWGKGQNDDFQETPAFLALRTDAPLVEAIAEGLGRGREDSQIAKDLGPDVPAQQMAFWMRELSEIVLLDFIFSQQDRVGNIDFTPYYYWIEEGELKHKKAKHHEPGDGDVPESAALLRRSNLNDNDAGGRVAYANFAKSTQMLEKLRHFDGGRLRAPHRARRRSAVAGAAPRLAVLELRSVRAPDRAGGEQHAPCDRHPSGELPQRPPALRPRPHGVLPDGNGRRRSRCRVTRHRLLAASSRSFFSARRRPGAFRVVVISDLNGSYGSVDYDPRVGRAVTAIIAMRPDLVISTGRHGGGPAPSAPVARPRCARCGRRSTPRSAIRWPGPASPSSSPPATTTPRPMPGSSGSGGSTPRPGATGSPTLPG